MKRRAFTVPELLTVIAILALLASLLEASLSRARGQAQASFCRNNLSEIGKALAIYTADFKEYPGTHASPVSIPPDGPARWDLIWDRRLLPCVSGNQTIFLCPVGQPRHVEEYFSLTNYSYGYNAYGTGIQSPGLNLGLGRVQPPENDLSSPILPVTDSQLKAASDMIAIGDLNDLPSVFATTIEPNVPPPYAGAPAERHSGGANMVFCDGHTEFALRNTWIAETADARRRWNNDHEPHPETW